MQKLPAGINTNSIPILFRTTGTRFILAGVGIHFATLLSFVCDAVLRPARGRVPFPDDGVRILAAGFLLELGFGIPPWPMTNTPQSSDNKIIRAITTGVGVLWFLTAVRSSLTLLH